MMRAYLYLIDFVLPLPMTAVMFVLWQRRTGSTMFAAYVLALGVLFGYIYPGIGTNVLHLWKFSGPLRVGNYFLHHGFMYAPYLALVFYVAFPEGAPLTIGNSLRIVLCCAFVQCVLSCHHDYCGVSTGMIEINSAAARARRSPVEIVTDFGVVSFALVGATFSASCLIAYHFIVVRGNRDSSTFVLLIAMALGLMGVPALQYLIKDRRERRV
jgi:hypothetical protein